MTCFLETTLETRCQTFCCLISFSDIPGSDLLIPVFILAIDLSGDDEFCDLVKVTKTSKFLVQISFVSSNILRIISCVEFASRRLGISSSVFACRNVYFL